MICTFYGGRLKEGCKKKMVEEETEHEEKDCPVLPKDWVFLLSNEINTLYVTQSAITAVCATMIVGFLGAFLVLDSPSIYFERFALCWVVLLTLYALIVLRALNKGIRTRRKYVKQIIKKEIDPKQLCEELLQLVGKY